jgi:hypothetical protein
MSVAQCIRLSVLAGVATLLLAGESVMPDANGRLLDLGPALDLSTLTCNASTAEHAGTSEAPALRITAQAQGSWPGVNIPAPGGSWDLSAYAFIALDLRNVDNHDIDIFVRIDNPGANGHDHCMTERIGTQPDQRVTLTIPIKRVSQSSVKLFGMHGFPDGLYASGGIDPANIVAITVFTENKPKVSHSFEVSAVRAFGAYVRPAWADMTPEQFFPCIDTFGQFIHKEWPGKVHTVEDLQANRVAEAKQLETAPAPANWDAWGGWADGPQLEATGHFRTAKHAGKWWLVDPDGRLFFSVGLTCVGPGFAGTPVDDRESWFADLPSADDHPLKAFLRPGGKSWGGGYYAGKSPKILDVSGANLLRKYGPEWKTIYTDIIHKRLRAWGVNSIGNWSDWGVTAARRTPYTRTFFYDVPRLKANKVNFPDMFDPGFAAALDKGAKQFLQGTTDDPWCIGYFVDNEMPWGGEDTLAMYALGSPEKQAAKRRFAAWLQERHGADIAILNTAWGTTWADWSAFAADTKAKPATGAAKKDLYDFTGLAAETYFREVRDAIRRIAPQKLYLGCRCVGGSRNVVEAAVKYNDVLSYNRYCASVRDITLPEGLDAPVIIGEFHFGGLDRGQFWGGLFSAENQQDRAAKFTAYVRSALDNPQLVGVHWFQYGDEATTGRIDGENAQCGFVDICDTPYVETVTAARASAETMYTVRAAAR